MANGVSFAQGVTEVQPAFSNLSGTLTASTQMAGIVAIANGGTSASAIGSNQVLSGNGTGSYIAFNSPTRLVAFATALALTASGDQTLTMSNAANLGSYIVRRVTWAAPLTSALATCIVTAILRTASSGAGSALTGAFIVTGFNATNEYLDQTVTLASTIVTASQLYVNVTVSAGTAPTSQLFVYADVLGV